MTKIAIIGGSGLENPDLLKHPEQITVNTPYGIPSSQLLCGEIGGRNVVILSRHGLNHTIPPTQINNRANIFALKEAGCTHILASTACGSLRGQIGRGDLVIPDQFIDFTKQRTSTFFQEFEPGKMKHTAMPEPFDRKLREIIIAAASEMGLKFHPRGTVVTIEGPRFSTRAESLMFRSWGADIINMSTATEAILANEAGIPYAAIAMSTDFDSWKQDEVPVSWEEVIRIFNENVHNVLKLIMAVIEKVR